MTVQRWVLIPEDGRLPARVFDDREAAVRASAWCPGRIIQAIDEVALANRRRA